MHKQRVTATLSTMSSGFDIKIMNIFKVNTKHKSILVAVSLITRPTASCAAPKTVTDSVEVDIGGDRDLNVLHESCYDIAELNQTYKRYGTPNVVCCYTAPLPASAKPEKQINTDKSTASHSPSSSSSSSSSFWNKRRKVERDDYHYSYDGYSPNPDKANNDHGMLSMLQLYHNFEYVLKTDFDDGLVIEGDIEEKLTLFKKMTDILLELQAVYEGKQKPDFFDNGKEETFFASFIRLEKYTNLGKDTLTRQLAMDILDKVVAIYKHNSDLVRQSLTIPAKFVTKK